MSPGWERRLREGVRNLTWEVCNESPVASMFQKQQTANDLQNAREAYLSILEKGKQLGMHEEAHAEPVRRSENDTYPIAEFDTVDTTADATVPKRIVNPNCVPNPFHPQAACDKSVYDVLVAQQFQDCITTAQPTTQAVSSPKSHKERHGQGKGVKTSALKSKWKANLPWLNLRTVAHDDHGHPWSEHRSTGTLNSRDLRMWFSMTSSTMILLKNNKHCCVHLTNLAG